LAVEEQVQLKIVSISFTSKTS